MGSTKIAIKSVRRQAVSVVVKDNIKTNLGTSGTTQKSLIRVLAQKKQEQSSNQKDSNVPIRTTNGLVPGLYSNPKPMNAIGQSTMQATGAT
jgi:hypothetical protein